MAGVYLPFAGPAAVGDVLTEFRRLVDRAPSPTAGPESFWKEIGEAVSDRDSGVRSRGEGPRREVPHKDRR